MEYVNVRVSMHLKQELAWAYVYNALYRKVWFVGLFRVFAIQITYYTIKLLNLDFVNHTEITNIFLQ